VGVEGIVDPSSRVGEVVTPCFAICVSRGFAHAGEYRRRFIESCLAFKRFALQDARRSYEPPFPHDGTVPD